jgi:Leucine-rich repeat (LRR) protein
MTEEPDVTGSSIVPAPRGALDSRIRDLVKRGLESLLAQEKHTIEFPADYSLGTLYIGDEDALRALEDRGLWLDPGQKEEAIRKAPVKALDARGQITIAANEKALLETYWHGLSALKGLSSDALWGMKVDSWRQKIGPTNVEPGHLGHIAGLTGLQQLSLGGPGITDTGVAQLGRLVNLKSLRFWVAERITDAVLTRMNGLIALEELDLNGTRQITDAGIDHLRGLVNLKDLELGGTQITDTALIHLSGLAYLKSLNLTQTQITDAGLTYLSRLVSIKTLGLGGTQITDAGLAHLKRLTTLEELYLHETLITDAGLVHLKGLTNLRRLTLSKTKVTEAGLIQLRGLRHLEWPIPLSL